MKLLSIARLIVCVAGTMWVIVACYMHRSVWVAFFAGWLCGQVELAIIALVHEYNEGVERERKLLEEERAKWEREHKRYLTDK